jgi:hypothetical protein
LVGDEEKCQEQEECKITEDIHFFYQRRGLPQKGSPCRFLIGYGAGDLSGKIGSGAE